MVSIFISHKHSDEEVATAVRDMLLGIAVPAESIFYSSDPRFGPKPGEGINQSLTDQIRATDLLLLVYTDPGKDWTYPIFETTWALASDTKNTNVVVLSLFGDVPSIIEHNKFVNLGKRDEVCEFARLTSEDRSFLVPDDDARKRQENSFFVALENFDETVRNQRCVELCEKLDEIIRRRPPDTKPNHRLDYLKVRIPKDALEVITAGNRTKDATTQVLSLASIIEISDNSALKLFGIANISEDLTLEILFSQWQSSREELGTKKLKGSDLEWVSDFVSDIWRVAKDVVSTPSENWFSGTEQHNMDQYFQLLIARSEKDRDGSLLLGIYIYKYRERQEPKNQKRT